MSGELSPSKCNEFPYDVSGFRNDSILMTSFEALSKEPKKGDCLSILCALVDLRQSPLSYPDIGMSVSRLHNLRGEGAT